jgi:hypothetical protein
VPVHEAEPADLRVGDWAAVPVREAELADPPVCDWAGVPVREAGPGGGGGGGCFVALGGDLLDDV